MEVNDLEVAEEFSATATLYFWAKGVWMARWGRGQHKAWRKQIFEVRTWRQVRGPAGVVMCEARDFGVPLRQWHTLLFGRQVALDMGVVCPQDVKKWAAKHDCEELKGRVVLRRKANELWTDQQRKVMRKLVVQGGWMQKRLCDTGSLDEMKCRGCIKAESTGKHRLYHSPFWRGQKPARLGEWEQRPQRRRKTGLGRHHVASSGGSCEHQRNH